MTFLTSSETDRVVWCVQICFSVVTQCRSTCVAWSIHISNCKLHDIPYCSLLFASTKFCDFVNDFAD